MLDKPTHGENTLDIFLTNCPDLIKSRNIVPGIGEHHEPASRTKRYRRSIDSWIKLILITSRKKFKKSLTASLKHTPLLILQMSSGTVSEITWWQPWTSISQQNSTAVRSYSHGSQHKQNTSFAKSKGGSTKQNDLSPIAIGVNTKK